MINDNDLQDLWIKNKDKFKQIVSDVKYDAYGMWFTEAFLFCTVSELLGVDLILESGRANGVSTEIFAKYFDFDIISVDMDVYNLKEVTEAKLNKYENVDLRYGDGFKVLPQTIDENADKTISVFIDGPKGKHDQSKLRDLCNKDNVAMFGYHDRTPEEDCLHTHTIDWLTNDFNYLNDTIEQQHLVTYNIWKPYGPGVLIEVT